MTFPPCRPLCAALAIAAIVLSPLARPRAQQAEPAPVFRTGTSFVSVDIVVRDESGTIVRGLTAGDFTIREDGRPQQIQTFSFEEIADRPPAVGEPIAVLADVETRLRED